MPAARPTEALISRTIRAWKASGLPIGGIEVRPDGTVIVLAESVRPAQPAPTHPEGNSCDGKFGAGRT